MPKELARYLIVAVAGLALWKAANALQGTSEPWDSPSFLGFYGAAVALSAVFGFVFPERAWRWGVILVFALVPVMVIDSPPAAGADMSVIGLLILAVLSFPAALAGLVAAMPRKPQRRF